MNSHTREQIAVQVSCVMLTGSSQASRILPVSRDQIKVNSNQWGAKLLRANCPWLYDSAACPQLPGLLIATSGCQPERVEVIFESISSDSIYSPRWPNSASPIFEKPNRKCARLHKFMWDSEHIRA